MSALGAYLIEAMLTLVLVGALGAALVYLTRRAGTSTGSGGLTVCGRLALDARKAIYLVKMGDQVLVLGSSEAGLHLLTTVPAKDLPEPQAVRASLLQQFISRLNAARAHDNMRKAARIAEGTQECQPSQERQQRS
ncbi:MAG TPA: flagellar biosynthetic protein FliO [Polyangiaceae bacterium]|nr:flagellar biosynthetic protein FliO [Polyangiaceae bacterium]